jgi:putative membrane protein
MMHWGNMFGYGWGMGFGWLYMILFWGIIIGLVVFAVKAVAKSSRGQSWCEDPMNILKNRYAHGEITKEQYEEMRHNLKSS